jgi:hypothetical protein
LSALNPKLSPDQDATALVAVYDGSSNAYVGFIIRRLNSVEAFDADATALGIYPNIETAAGAVWRRARGQS